MNKRLVWLCLFIVMLVSNSAIATDHDVQVVKTANSIADVYNKIDFSSVDKLAYDVFAKAYIGYMNLKADHKLNSERQILTICDYSKSANTNRMWLIDLANNTVLLNTYVAHGQGTGEEYARNFSNREGSHQSSLGFYVTGATYTGKHGNSMYLHGMDEGYNSAAFERSIVLHGAGYVSRDFIAGTGRLGRSWGCPAVSEQISEKVIDLIKDGTCLFIYYPERKYLANSRWLKGAENEM